MELTPNDERLATIAFYQGPAALLAEGLSRDATLAFSQRPEVVEYWILLKREFDIHAGLRARSKFAALRNLHRMIDPASAVVAQSLAGPEYERDKQGNILRDGAGRPILVNAEITHRQLDAAKFVLGSVGIADHKVQGDAASDPSLKLLFATTEDEVLKVEDDPLHTTNEQRALSRERVRNAMQRLSPRVIEAHAKVRDGLGITATPTKVKPKAVKKGTRARKKDR